MKIIWFVESITSVYKLLAELIETFKECRTHEERTRLVKSNGKLVYVWFVNQAELWPALVDVITKLLLTLGLHRCSAQQKTRACLAEFLDSSSAPPSPGRNTVVTFYFSITRRDRIGKNMTWRDVT